MSKDNYISLSNKEIRGYARERLLGNMAVPALATILFAFSKYIFQFCQELGIIGASFPAFIFYTVLSVAVSTAWGIFKYGLHRFYISFVTKKETNIANLFAGFRESTETILAASLVLSIISVICYAPFYIYGFFFAEMNITGICISVGLYLLCGLLNNLISIILFPIYFIICDHPGVSFTTAFIISFTMMSFKKWFKFLRLQISFIPLLILSYMSFGIGFLWVLPYVYTSYTYFYEDLCEDYCNKTVSNNESD